MVFPLAFSASSASSARRPLLAHQGAEAFVEEQRINARFMADQIWITPALPLTGEIRCRSDNVRVSRTASAFRRIDNLPVSSASLALRCNK